jgi:MFS transporter, PAT family, beta-lactamase induction signal transducer AmpG
MQIRNRFWQDILSKKMLVCIFTGFTSGLPLFILISLLPAWLRSNQLDLKAIGLFALIQLPYTWKFLWAPFFDRFRWHMGRRRGWLLFFQALLLISIPLLGFYNPQTDLTMIVVIATLIAFLSASQDIVIDAYRRELLLDKELGLGNAVHVNAYKIASLIPGSLSLILADHFDWQTVFIVTSLFMLPGLVFNFCN